MRNSKTESQKNKQIRNKEITTETTTVQWTEYRPSNGFSAVMMICGLQQVC